MKLSEIANVLLVRSGVYVLGGITDVNFNMQTLWDLVKIELLDYMKYKP